MNQKLVSTVLSAITLLGVSVANTRHADAAVFNATFTSTVSNNSGVDNVSVGDIFKVTVTLDNGDDSLISQTWNPSDVQSITFDFGDGAHKTVFNSYSVGGGFVANGKFSTNASGELIEVPVAWEDTTVSIISTNSVQTPSAWFLNGANNIYSTFFGSVGISNVSSMLTPSNWTIASASATSVPESSSLLGLTTITGLGVTAALKRKRKI